jgi:hypothetical protein
MDENERHVVSFDSYDDALAQLCEILKIDQA